MKLYKELVYSYVLGLGVSSGHVYYHYRQYMKEVDTQYRVLRQMFADNPALELIDDDLSMNKNFGLSQYTVWDHEEEVAAANMHDPFEGGENSQKETIKNLLRDF